MRLALPYILFSLVVGILAAPSGKTPVRASWYKQGNPVTTLPTAETIKEPYAESLIQQAVEQEAKSLGLATNQWIWDGFDKAVPYDGMRKYEKKEEGGTGYYLVADIHNAPNCGWVNGEKICRLQVRVDGGHANAKPMKVFIVPVKA